MTIAEQIARAKTDYDEVYNAGYEKGKSEGGGDNYYDIFWDNAQAQTQGVLDYMFAGNAWNDVTFDPKYSMKPSKATGMFRRNGFTGDIPALLERKNITLDFSECTAMTYLFYESNFSRIGVVDCSKAGVLTGTFGYAYYCNTIDEVILSEENTFNNTSFRLPSLVEIRIRGTIANSGVDFRWSTKLSKASIESIINALSTTTSGLTVTFSQEAIDRISAEEEGGSYVWWYRLAGDGENDGIRPNWNIVLV